MCIVKLLTLIIPAPLQQFPSADTHIEQYDVNFRFIYLTTNLRLGLYYILFGFSLSVEKEGILFDLSLYRERGLVLFVCLYIVKKRCILCGLSLSLEGVHFLWFISS
jgi:hypothetical protein